MPTMTTSPTSQEREHEPSSKPSPSGSQSPYWNMNLPSHLHTANSPPYLHNLSPKDILHLHLPDSSYTPLSWSQILTLITTNRLQEFTRLPSDLHKYRKFVYDLTKRYGSVETYMLEERLGWDAANLDSQGRGPFEERSDYKILMNDWPYGVEDGVKHLVVWTKFSLGGEEMWEDTGRDAIEAFMEETFYPHIPRDHVVWFRNWGSLKSVHAVEHFHIMLLKPDASFLNSVVEEPLSTKPSKGLNEQ